MRTIGARRSLAVPALAVGLVLAGCGSAETPEPAAGGVAQEESPAAAATGEPGAGDAAASEPAAGGSEPTDGGSEPTDGSQTAEGEADAGAEPGAALSDEVLSRVEEQFPALARVLPEAQLRDLVSRACTSVRSGDLGTAQRELQERFPVDPGTAQQVVAFLDQDVCSA